jgi:hypothetical protein
LKGKLDCEFKIRGYWANNKPQGKTEIKFFTGGTFVGATNLGLPGILDIFLIHYLLLFMTEYFRF